jgi:aspartate carbamoyltransferase catalytic subunit
MVSPPELKMSGFVTDYLRNKNIQTVECEKLEEVISDIDVLYTTIIHKSKFGRDDLTTYDRLLQSYYHIDPKTLEKAKDDVIVMNPLPRMDERGYQTSSELDNTRYAKYFDQVFNGLVIRMALLSLVCGA